MLLAITRGSHPVTYSIAVTEFGSVHPRSFDSQSAWRPSIPDTMLRTLPAGFIEPCLPTKADTLPSGGLWLHEIKHDGFRIIARKSGAQVRLYSRPGNDLTDRFPLIVETLANLRTRSYIIDGEAVACDDNGLPVFDRIRYRRHDGKVFPYAFDLIELDGDDLRREPLDVRKATLRSLLVKVAPGLRWNEHIEGDGETIFRHACQLGLEGIVSKRKDSPYRSGRSPDWVKMKNPNAPAVRREAEEDWKWKGVAMTGKNRIMIYGPKEDGTYLVEFRTSEGDVLSISIPRNETGVIRHFQERMPYGLFVLDDPSAVPWPLR
jgi:bifunctional non-homologous end joining protein LigD